MMAVARDKRSLQRYYDNELYSDIEVSFGDHEIHAHRLILAEASDYFRAAFERGFKVRPCGRRATG